MTACYDADEGVDIRAAAAILEPYVDAIYTEFLSFGLTKLRGISIRITEEAHNGGRNFAACEDTGRLILLSPQMVLLPPETAAGIIAHEFGHAADYAYPAQWAKTAKGEAVLLDISRRGGETLTSDWIADWRDRSPDHVERTADQIAETVLGMKIGYAGPCMLQTLGRGISPRPRGLR